MADRQLQLIRANIEPDTVYEVHMIVEEQRNGKTYYMLVDQHRHLVYATKLLRYLIYSYGYEEDVTTIEEISNENIFNYRFDKTPFCTVTTNSKRRFSFYDTVSEQDLEITF